MTQDEIIRMAREAGFIPNDQAERAWLERFAALVAEATKEKAAKVCKDYAEKCAEAENWEAEDVALVCAAAIRSMK